MKLLHFADLHIGVENHGRVDPATGLSSRLGDFLAAFDELVDTAITEQVDAVIFAGDAYKSRNPEQTHQREFARRVMVLARAGIPVYLLVGNHDVPAMRMRASALEIFGVLGVENVVIGDRLGTTTLQTRSGPLQVVGVPWPSVSMLLNRDEYRNLPIDQVDRELERVVTGGIAREADKLDPALPAILTAHIAMSASIVKTASEGWMTIGRFPQLNRSDLRPDAFDYVALGHHHCYQVLYEHPPMVYAGSTQRVDFGEEGDPKGFVLIDLDPERPRGERVRPEDVHFRPVHARRFVTIDLRPHDEDPTPEVLRAIEKRSSDIDGGVVRVLLTLTSAQARNLDERTLRQTLSSAHTVAGVSRTIVNSARARLGADQVPEMLQPIDAVRMWLEWSGSAPDRRETLLEHARHLIDGDELPPVD